MLDTAPERMLDEILNGPDRLVRKLPTLNEKLRGAVGSLPAKKPSQVVLVGCGDSLYASLGMRLLFQRLGGLPVEPFEALEFSRYFAAEFPADTLVIGISESGLSASTRDALTAAGARGMTTVALVDVPASPVAQAADVSVNLDCRRAKSVPGTFSYLASLLGLALCATHLGESRGHLSSADVSATNARLAEELGANGTAAKELLGAAQAFARKIRPDHPIYMLGAGPSHATAEYAAAKLFESCAILGVAVHLEEWGHEQALLIRDGDLVVIFAPPGRTSDRIQPTLVCVKELGGRALVIGPSAIDGRCETWPVQPGDEAFASIRYAAPASLIAYALTERLDRQPFQLDSPERVEASRRLTRVPS